MKRPFLLFILILILACFHQDLWITNSNTTSRALPVIAFFESGSFCIDRYHEKTNDKSFIHGHYYSDKAPLPTLITIPFFGLMKMAGLVEMEEGSLYGSHVYLLGNILCGSVPFAVIVFLTVWYAIQKGADPRRSFLLGMLGIFGSFIFVFSGTYFAHMLSALFFLLAFVCLEQKKFARAGLLAGLSFLSEYTIALIFPIWFFQIMFREKSIKAGFQFVLGLIPSVFFILHYNYYFTGSPFDMLYKFHNFEELHTGYGFSFPTPESIWGLSFSPYRGLLFYAPVLLVFLVYAVLRIIKMNAGELAARLLKDYSFLVSIVFFFVIASYFGWHGGWTYGPRLLFPVAALLILRAVPLLVSGSYYLPSLIASGVGFVFALMAKATHAYSLPTEELNPVFSVVVPAFFKGDFNGNELVSMFSGASPVWGVAGFVFVFGITCFLFSSRTVFYRYLEDNR